MLGKAHYAKNEKKDTLRCFREALKLDAYYNEVWTDLGRMILYDGFVRKALPYLEKAYKIIGDVPGINYILASYYLHSRSMEKAHRHYCLLWMLIRALQGFSRYFPVHLFNRKIKKLLENYNIH